MWEGRRGDSPPYPDSYKFDEVQRELLLDRRKQAVIFGSSIPAKPEAGASLASSEIAKSHFRPRFGRSCESCQISAIKVEPKASSDGNIL